MLRSAVRFLALSLVVGLPFALAFSAISSFHGIFLGAGSGIALVLVAALTAEMFFWRAVRRASGGAAVENMAILREGLERTLAQVYGPARHTHPAVTVFMDPAPRVVSVRSLGGGGTVLLSQGVLTILKEEELRAILRWAAACCKSPTAPLLSASGLIACVLLGTTSRQWAQWGVGSAEPSTSDHRRMGGLGVAAAVWFFLLLPAAKVVLRVGCGKRSFAPNPQRRSEDPELDGAMRKIEAAARLWSPHVNPGSFPLHVVVPAAGDALLSP